MEALGRDGRGAGAFGADALDRLAVPGGDLLGRVDHLLTVGGAPEDHPVWPLVRQLRALPGDAAAAVVALRAEPLTAAGTEVRELLPEYAAIQADLTVPVAWKGAAAEHFGAHRAALANHLGAAPEGLSGRLTSTAGYADAIADWVVATRMALAQTLAGVLASAEAVLLRSVEIVAVGTGAALVAGQPLHAGRPAGQSSNAARSAQAAAEIGARVLATVAAAYDEAEALLQRWRPDLAEVSYRPPDDGPVPLDATLRIGH